MNSLSTNQLRYTIVNVKFSNIEAIESYISHLQDSIRDVFFHFKEVIIRDKCAHEVCVRTSKLEKKWFFINKKKDVYIILDKQSLTIVSKKYDKFASDHDRFSSFLENVKSVITKFNEILKINLFIQLSISYFNVLETDVADKNNEFMTKTESLLYEKSSIIKVQSICLKNKSLINQNIKEILLFANLLNAYQLLSFENIIVQKDSFLISNIEYMKDIEESFDLTNILDNFNEMNEKLQQLKVEQAIINARDDY